MRLIKSKLKHEVIDVIGAFTPANPTGVGGQARFRGIIAHLHFPFRRLILAHGTSVGRLLVRPEGEQAVVCWSLSEGRWPVLRVSLIGQKIGHVREEFLGVADGFCLRLGPMKYAKCLFDILSSLIYLWRE